ncbi:hypothetical protein KIN20_012794 [Parelaphostrongylus tenuis]|uniref:Uncharacterized protein n=1 Tax=Parelaphostrongylus tenuis TaxID=148309 RepID=A0AAD5MCM8_PARTN|nr:hypothetical protein KIN20_012794 [Parelaphostrongylus tenuis]
MVKGAAMKKPHCIIVSGIVTGTCEANDVDCKEIGMAKAEDIGSISANHTAITGTLTITNIIMANWSKEMWQSVVNRAIRMLASGPLRLQFFSAFATSTKHKLYCRMVRINDSLMYVIYRKSLKIIVELDIAYNVQVQ